MKQESINKLKQLIISTYRKHGDKTVLVRKNQDKRSWTGNEIADEIEKETDFGIKIIDMLIQLTIDLLTRDKINQNL